MSVTLVVEDGTGKATANTFADVASVTAALAAHPFASAWASCTKQAEVCVEASAWLTRLLWDGMTKYDTQALAFPRVELWTYDGFLVSDTIVPPFVLQAHARLCLYLAQQLASPFADTGLQPGSVLEVGPIKLTPAANPVMLPPDVRAIIGPYVRTSRTLVRA